MKTVDSFLIGWIDQSIININFKIKKSDSEQQLLFGDFLWNKPENSTDRLVLTGKTDELSVIWTFVKLNGSLRVDLLVESENPLGIESISPLIFDYIPARPVSEMRFLYCPLDGLNNPAGTLRLDEITHPAEPLRSPAGTFYDHRENGLFLSAMIPQTNLNKIYFTAYDDRISWETVTEFNLSLQQNTRLRSEVMYITTNFPALKAFEQFADNYPLADPPKRPVKGWGSWDYYYSTVTMEDIEENMAALEQLPFKKEIEIIQIDDGWQYLWGEWEPNYKFPANISEVAQRIIKEGYIPGIWTAPVQIDETTTVALRRPEMLVKNEHGDPCRALDTNNFLIDPTSPAGEAYIRELFTKLYDAGFRYFKVDFVNSYLNVKARFHDPRMGVYDVIRHLFKIIRESVKDSHILGCSLPPETGAWVADSGRTGFDIHNQWTHVQWAAEYYLFCFWMQNRLWINDIDFLVVRGTDTCTEGGLNVTDPNLNNPDHKRWRRGPVFNGTEAETWTNMIRMSGSNIMLSDRLKTLNEFGIQLVRKVFDAPHVSAIPLDICDRSIPSFWLQRTGELMRLTVINWEDESVEVDFVFDDYAIKPPKTVINEVSGEIQVENGLVTLDLKPHGSAVITWAYE